MGSCCQLVYQPTTLPIYFPFIFLFLPYFAMSARICGALLEVAMKLLPKTCFVLAGALFALTANAQDVTGTLKKIKDSGAITLGARESSGALAYTLGDGKYVGFH